MEMIGKLTRQEVESIGSSGAGFEEKEEYFLCKTMNSFYICADKEDHGYTPHAKSDGYWESWITSWMLNNVPENSFVADVGANHGYYSLLLAENNCYVHAFEPQEKLSELIEKSAKINNFNIKVFNQAVSDKSGEEELIIPIHHGMNATITTPGYMPDGFVKEFVSTAAIDDMAVDYDFIKIDAEGGERKIWNGMQNFIENNPDCLYLLEWRYDRYEDPEEFAKEIFEKFNVTNVEFSGLESPLTIEKMLSVHHEDWMLVLRKKNV